MGSAGTRQFDTDSSTIWENTGQFVHFAITKTGTSCKLYINGVEETTINGSYTNNPAASIDLSSLTLSIGANPSGSYPLNASNIDEFRISNHIRYSGNFTPSTTAFSNDANTKFLLHSDNGGNVGAYGTAQSDGLSYYYTDIKGSTPIKDPRIGAHFGSQRHRISSGQISEKETSAQGESVYKVDGREWMRVVGPDWIFQNASNGAVIYVPHNKASGTNFIEVTGYFHDVNLNSMSNTLRDIKTSVDGTTVTNVDTTFTKSRGAPTGDLRFMPAAPIGNLNLNKTLGIHTLKIENIDGDYLGELQGVEFITQDVQNFTATNATNILTSAGHTLTNGDQIRLAGSDLPNGLNATTTYYVIGVSGNNFQVSASLGGSAVTFSDDGSGTRTFRSLNTIQIPAQNVVSYGKKFSVSANATHYNPFAFKTDGSTAWAAAAHNGTSWPVGTGASSNIDTATSLGLENWKHSSNYYKPYNGGRVVKWIASDGTIKTSVNVMPPNAQHYIQSAIAAKANASVANDTHKPTFSGAIDDSQAEVAKTYHWREFGNGSANGGVGAAYADCQMLDATDDQLAFVMEDGLTSFSHSYCDKHGGGFEAWTISTNSHNAYYTFIGTGIKVKQINTNTLNWLWDVYVDGVQIIDGDTFNGVGWKNLAQNLPYGTHVVRFHMHEGTGAQVAALSEMSISQPKMPPIPNDAVVIADYMLMADFKPISGNHSGTNIIRGHEISKGARGQAMTSDVLTDNDDAWDVFAGANVPGGHTYGYRLTSSGTASSATSVTVRISPFATNYVVRSYRFTSRHELYIGTTSQSGNRTNEGAGGNSTDSYDTWAHLTNDQPLGVHDFGFNSLSGQAMNASSFEIASPIHTSSHYQTFETPYLHELVGGDRNMEQTNLVVTADGKTWDQVTRDTNYISNVRFQAGSDSSDFDSTQVFFPDNLRGTQGTRDLLVKDFVPAQDRLICLVDGVYVVGIRGYASNIVSVEIKINGTLALQHNLGAGGGGQNFDPDVSVHLRRGDYIQWNSPYNGGHYGDWWVRKV